jgi:hypothetical protein
MRVDDLRTLECSPLCWMYRKALYELGKRPYDQRRSSAFLKGAMNLTGPDEAHRDQG